MKLVTFVVPTPGGHVQRVGALVNGKVVDLNMSYVCLLSERPGSSRAYEKASVVLPSSIIHFLRAGQEGREAAEAGVEYVIRKMGKGNVLGPGGETVIYDMAQVKLKAPVPRPNSLRDCSTYEDHVSFFGKVADVWYRMPVYYKGNPDAVIGPEETILWPSFSDRLDYELELGIYIGKQGMNIPRERAEEHIAGYTIFNDISARDIQREEMSFGLGPSKGKDTCNVMGPCLVTPDELDPRNLRMVARINGEVWSEGDSSTSYWTWPQILEFISMDETLYPGDFIGMGTVGKGSGIELNRWVKPGDVIELEIQGIGILRNRVGEKPPKRSFTR